MLNDESGQSSTELLLLFASIIIVVLISMNIYHNYLLDFSNEINKTEMNNLINNIDKINEFI